MNGPKTDIKSRKLPTIKGEPFSKTLTRLLNGRTRQIGAIEPFLPKDIITEKALIEAFCRGDSQVLRAIYLVHFPDIEAFITKNSGNLEEAKDVFQDALLIAYQKVSSPGFTLSCKLSTFIFAVAKRLWQKKIRDERPLALLTTGNIDEIEQESIDLLIKRMQRFKLYEDKFSELSEGCQELLKRFLKGDSTEQVRAHFGFGSTSYTKKRKCKCKARLLKLIMDDPAYADLIHND